MTVRLTVGIRLVAASLALVVVLSEQAFSANRDSEKANRDSEKANRDSEKANRDSEKANRDSEKSVRQRVLLWPKGAPFAEGDTELDKPSIEVYSPPKNKANGCAVVICPGGGYGHLALGHEGDAIGQWANSFGVTAFVLRYRIAPRYHHPAPMLDVQRAIRTVRSGAKTWRIDPARVGVLGFSAGGHLASTAATHFDKGNPNADDPIDRVSCRPDFTILCYPVVTLTMKYTHRGSRRNLIGKHPAPQLVEDFSNEKQVTKNTPPTFLFCTNADTAVPAENSVLFYLALRKSKVPAELHIFEPGGHGVGLASQEPAVSAWPNLCKNWLKGRGLLTGKK